MLYCPVLPLAVQSKGLEWNTVFIINANDGDIPLVGKGTTGQMAEGSMVGATAERGASLEVRQLIESVNRAHSQH